MELLATHGFMQSMQREDWHVEDKWETYLTIKEAPQRIHWKPENIGSTCPQHHSQKHCWSKQIRWKKLLVMREKKLKHWTGITAVMIGWKGSATHQNSWKWGFQVAPPQKNQIQLEPCHDLLRGRWFTLPFLSFTPECWEKLNKSKTMKY